MAEGGLYPWKVQKINSLPIANYHDMTLGQPPAGLEWTQNAETREWTLREREVAAVAESTSTPDVVVETVNVDNPESVRLAHAEPIIEHNYQRHHVVMDTDTLQGICLKYKVTATQLRQANCFSGTNLKLAPKVLKIPPTIKAQAATPLEIAQTLHSKRENKIAIVMAKSKGSMSRKEVCAYLEMSDWNVEEALNEIRNDQEFELLQQRGK